MKAFIFPQFIYCPLVWMCHRRKLNNKMNSLHERTLRIVYQDKKPFFKELLQRDKSVTIHVRSLQYLTIEIFKVQNGLAPKLMCEIFYFIEDENYNLKIGQSFLQCCITKTTNFRLQSVTNLGAKIPTL